MPGLPACVLACVLACKLPSPSIQRPVDEHESEPSGREPHTPEPHTIEARDGATLLLDAGAEPRTLLRYHARVGEVVHWEMGMRMDTTVVLLDQNVQTQVQTEFDFETEIVSVDEAARKYEYRTTFVDAQFLTNVQDPSALDPYVGLVASTRTTDRGELLEYGYSRAGKPIDPSTVKGLENPAVNMLTFPEQPIGIGALWQKYDEVERNGFLVLQTSEHRLVAREGDRVEIATKITQEPLTRVMDGIEMPPDTHAEILRFESVGAGTAILDLGIALPVEATVSVRLDMGALIIAPGSKTEMTMVMTMQTNVSRTR